MATISDLLLRLEQEGDPGDFGKREDVDRPAPGAPADHRLGVLYMGPWKVLADGFNEHVRRNAMALSAQGPVHLRSPGWTVHYGRDGQGAQFERRLGRVLNASVGSYSLAVYQFVLNEQSLANMLALPNHPGAPDPALHAALLKQRIVYSVFERDRVSPSIAKSLGRVGQVWVATHHDQDMLVRSGLPRAQVRVVPMPYFDDDPLLKMHGRTRKPGPPRFYHIGKWEPRKNQPAILQAFLYAFKVGTAQLCMKISNLQQAIDGVSSTSWTVDAFPQNPKVVLAYLVNDPRVVANGWTAESIHRFVTIMDQRLTTDQIRNLHALGDVYVTLSRGEGYDIPAFESKVAGNRMVYTPSGGPQEFTAGDDFFVPKTGMVACHKMYGWEKDAQYIDYSIEDAVAAMRSAALSVRSGRVVQHRISDWFSAQKVGERMAQFLGELVDPVFDARREQKTEA